MPGKKLEWENLKFEECPKCGYKLDKQPDDFRICQNSACDFVITRWRFKEITDNFALEVRKESMEGYGFN